MVLAKCSVCELAKPVSTQAIADDSRDRLKKQSLCTGTRLMHSQTFKRCGSLVKAAALCGLLAAASTAFSQTAAATSAIDCQTAATQAELNACAYEEFLVTQAEMADQLKPLQATYSAEQRAALRRVQRAWLGFRTEACSFESRGGGLSSAQPMRQWQCAARMTRERTAALARMANCPEGDLACVRPAAAGAAGQ